MNCRHCHSARSTRPRGLCWSCHQNPAIRALYPSTSKFARRGVGNGASAIAFPAFPTAALPGTEAKILILEQRAALRQELFHPDDAEMPGARTPHLERAG